MTNSNTKRIAAEKRVVRKVVRALLKAGYTVGVDYGEGELEYEGTKEADIMAAIHACDEEWLRVWKHTGEGSKVTRSSVFLVYGNADDGSEVVADYGMSLEAIIGPIIAD